MTASCLLFIYPLAGYLIGTIPTGLLIGFLKGIDVRTRGSGNIGATNVARVVGRGWGAFTLVADMAKGLVPVLAADLTLYALPGSALVVAATGFAAVAGHCFSIFLGFRGGKGVATAVGVFLAVCPASVAVAFVVFYASVKKWGYVSVGSLLSSIAVPPLIHIFCSGIEQEIMAWAIAAVIWVKHGSNIKRLRQGTEKSFRTAQ